MERSAAEELLALEARGVAMSRNQNFALFQESGPRRALDLHRRLAYIARIIHRHHDDPGFAVSIDPVAEPTGHTGSNGGGHMLCITLRMLSATLSMRFDELELSILMRDERVAQILVDAGHIHGLAQNRAVEER